MGWSSSNRFGILCMGALGGLYRPTPQGYNGNPAGCRTRLSVSLVAGFSAGFWGPPTGLVRSRQATPTAHGSCRLLITVAVMLMTPARSREHVYSPTARRAITVATPCLVWLMASGPRGRGGLTAGDRPPSDPTGGALAVFRALAGRWGPSSLGRTDRPSWEQGSVCLW